MATNGTFKKSGHELFGGIVAVTVRALALAISLASSVVSANADPWLTTDPAVAGWSTPKLAIAEAEVRKLGATGFVIIHDGKLVAGWGDIARKVNVRSVRKSLLSSLYGIAVAEGRISLDATLADLGIDDNAPGLTVTEKQAKVVDLLKARSGIYHPAAYETADMTASKPARGSAAPGTSWHYNNWDFNALGTIYRKVTGEDIFASFAARIAKPLGMEDFAANDGRYVTEPKSAHAAYPFMISARDLARFGQLYVDGGRWQGRQIIPQDWVRQSLISYSQTDRRNRGYGYMWWILDPAIFGSRAGLAAGFGGHYLAVIPAKRLVVVETASKPGAVGIPIGNFLAVLRLIAAAAP